MSEDFTRQVRDFFAMQAEETVGYGTKEDSAFTIPLAALTRKMKAKSLSAEEVLAQFASMAHVGFQETPEGKSLFRKAALSDILSVHLGDVHVTATSDATIDIHPLLYAKLLAGALAQTMGRMEGGRAIAMRPNEHCSASQDGLTLSSAAVDIMAADPEAFKASLTQVVEGQGVGQKRR